VSASRNLSSCQKQIEKAVQDYDRHLSDLGIKGVFRTLQEVSTMKDSKFAAQLSSSAEQISSLLNDFLKKCPETSPPSWVQDLAEFKEWRSPTPPSNTLWLTGPPGFGKSVLSAYVTGILSDSGAVAYFFCQDRTGLSEAQQVIRTFVYQLSVLSQQVLNTAQWILDKERSIRDRTANVRFLFAKLLSVAIRSIEDSKRPIFFIIDGLNEVPQAQLAEMFELVQMLQSLPVDPPAPAVRILLVSQPSHWLKFQGVTRLELTSTNNVSSVEQYVKTAMPADLRNEFRKLRQSPERFFCDNFQGMFLWVTAVLDHLISLDDLDDLEEILHKPPRGINEVYQKLLERLCRLNEYEIAWIREIILWSVMAKQALTSAEMKDAILLSRERYDRRKTSRLRDIESTLDKAAPIIQRVKFQNQTTVALLHDTFRQFITSKEDGPKGIAAQFLVDPGDANCTIAASCMTYLSSENIEFVPNLWIKDNVEAPSPLFGYASRFWTEHLAVATFKEDNMQRKLFHAVYHLLEREHLRSWISSVMSHVHNNHQRALSSPLSLSVMASLEVLSNWLTNSNNAARTSMLDDCPSWKAAIRTDGEFDWKLWCAVAAAEVWASHDPYEWESSVCSFDIALKLCLGEDREGGDLEAKVKRVAELVQPGTSRDGYKLFGNQALLFMVADETLAMSVRAEQLLRTALSFASEEQVPFALFRLGDCFRGRALISESLADADTAVQFTQDSLEAIDRDHFQYPSGLAFSADCLLVRSCLQPDEASKTADTQAAMEFCKKAFRSAITSSAEGVVSYFHIHR